MKKSVVSALEQAREHSEAFPDVTVRVMDRARKHAIVTASEWVYKEAINDGWHTVATFRDGKEVLTRRW